MVFPKWTNRLPAIILAALILLLGGATFIFWYWFSPKHIEVGYQPVQPIEFSHKLHAGQMQMDCRYCHYIVDQGDFAGVPPTEVCMNCHSVVQTESPEIVKLREYHAKGLPVPWVRVHDLPDYAYFDHSVHVNKGVGCVECHGRVDQMDRVRVVAPLSMSWCLDCHREPAPHIRDRALVTNLAWRPEGDPLVHGRQFVEKYNIQTRTDCSTCHR